MFTWPPDPSILYILIALLTLVIIIMFVHLKGGINTLLHLHATAAPPVVNVAPPAVNITHTVDQAYVDAAIARAMAAQNASTTPLKGTPIRRLV
jgi:hypothetical protein